MSKVFDKPWEKGALRVSEDKRTLQCGDTPFFWLGDTAWLLFQNLNVEQAKDYLTNRRHKNFNVIQATLVHSLPKEPDANSRNVNGQELAVLDHDFAKPNLQGGFWQQVDQVVEAAQSLGLFMGLLPCWGAMVRQGYLTMDNAAQYGRFLAERYGKYPNIIWIIGGDCRGSDGYDTWCLLAQTIKDLCPQHLMAYHPFGRTSSSLWFNEAKWLDMNMFQSGHRRYDQGSLGEWDDNSEKEGWFGEDNWRYVRRDHQASVMRPTLDAEPSYEQIPQGLHDPSEPFWQDYDARRYAYWSVLEGACGHTFGHSAIMQFSTPSVAPINYGAKTTWQEAMHDPGAGQMGHLYNLMASLPFATGRPAEELLAQPQKEKYARISVMAGEGFVLAYSYLGESFSLDLAAVKADEMQAFWFDPAAGVYSFIENVQCTGERTFVPPHKPSGHNDWVLLLKRA